MEIRILFFAQLRDFFGAGERSVRVGNGARVSELVHRLLDGPNAREMRSLPLLYAVNDEFVKADHELRDRDILVLIPPVAGG